MDEKFGARTYVDEIVARGRVCGIRAIQLRWNCECGEHFDS